MTENRGGRRWVPAYWLGHTDLPGGLHKLEGFMGDKQRQTVDPEYEYRLSFDAERSMWRLDTRKHVPGG